MKNLDKLLVKSIFILSLPAIIEMALNTMLGVADTIMVSRMINSAAVAASGYSNQIMYLIIFVFSSFNTGAIAMISRSYGEKNYTRMKNIANQNLMINFIVGIIISITSLIFYQQIFAIYEVTSEVQQYAYDYFTIIAWGMPFMFISFSLGASLRGIGDTKTPMYIVGFSNIINIFLNYFLIKGVWIFPEMGIKGAALATTISRLIAALIYLYIMIYKTEHIKFNLKLLKLTKDISSRLWELSYPGAIEQLFMQSSFLVAGVIISQLTTLEEASFRILLSIESISFMPAVGISIAAATLVGKALGEKNIKKALHTGYIASGMALLWGVLIGIIFILMPKTLLTIYTTDQMLINLSIGTMIAAGINQPFLNPMIVMTGALRGAGDTKAVMTIVTLRLWLLFVPLTYLFIIPLHQGVKGLWFAETISFIIFIPIVFIRFKNQKWSAIEI